MYSDVCDQDKAFFKLWNSFIHDVTIEKMLLNKDTLNTCIRFIHANSDKLKDMRMNLLMHLLALNNYRLLTAEQVYSLMKEYDKIQQIAN